MNSKIVKKRHRFYMWMFGPIIRLFLFLKCNYRWHKFKIEKNKNYLILSNHVTTYDPIYLYLSFNKPIYMLATDDIFNKGFLSKILVHIAAPIPKKKGMIDVTAIKIILRIIEQKGNVGIFLEGNRTFNGQLCTISPSIVKLIRKSNIPIICYNFVGGYGSDPRWALKPRFGRVTGSVKRIITPEEYNQITDDNLYNLIVKELTINDFDLPYKYKSTKKAEKLERILYICPKCKSISSLVSKGNFIECSECGLKVKYNDDLTLTADDKNFQFKIIPEWYSFQIEWVKKYNVFGREKEIYQDKKVFLIEISNNKKISIIENCVLIMTNISLIFLNDKKKVEIPLAEITSMASLLKTKICFYTDNRTYRITAGISFNGLKYVQMYYHIKNVKTGENDEYFGI